MKMLNTLEDVRTDDAREQRRCVREGLSILLRVLYPVAPHTTWVLWKRPGFDAALGDLLDAPWPEVDAAALQQRRGRARAPGQRQAARQARRAGERRPRARSRRPRRAAPEVEKHAAGAPVQKVVVVPGRLVNVVV